MSGNNFNILFITHRDPFYERIFFEFFFKNYPSLKDVKGVVIYPTLGKKSLGQLIKQAYNFYGFKDFVKMGVRFILYRILAKTFGLLNVKRFYSLEQVCKFYNIEIVEFGDINDPFFLKEMKRKDLDLVISVAAPKIFKESLLNLPKWGCINIHHAKLPKYRGMMPNFWQMYNDEKTAGITIHRMNPKIDEGQIILQREVEIEHGETLDSLFRRTKEIGAQLMIEAVDKIKNNKIEYVIPQEGQATYYSFPTKDEILEFKKMGKKIL